MFSSFFSFIFKPLVFSPSTRLKLEFAILYGVCLCETPMVLHVVNVKAQKRYYVMYIRNL